MRKLIFCLFIAVLSVGGFVFAADLYNNAVAVKVVAPYDHGTGDAAIVGEVVDGLGYNSITYIISVGSLADSDVTLTTLLEDCAEVACDTTNTAVADTFLLGTEALASYVNTEDNTVKMLGYTGSRRYTRMTITPANNTGAILIGVTAIKGHPQYAPVTH
jgi:hypothetical protein